MQRKIRVLFLMMMGISVLFCFGMFYIILQTKMEENVLDKDESNRNAVADNYERSFQNLNSISHLLMLRGGITSYLRYEKVDSSYTKEAVQEVYDVLYTFDVPCYVTIFRNDRQYVNTGAGVIGIDVDGIYYSKYLYDVLEKNGGYVIKSNQEGYFRKQSDRLVTLIRQVNDINTQKPLGYMAISVSHVIFRQMYDGLSDDKNHFAIYDDKGQRIDTDQPEMFEQKNREGREHLRIHKSMFREKIIHYEKIKDSEFVLATYSEVNLWSGLSIKIIVGLVVGVVLIILCLIYLNSYITHHVTQPIHRLVDSMSEVQNGWFHRVSMDVGDDEIGQLKNSYNAMLVEINQLLEESVTQEKNLQKAEMRALQEQIKPHFLYNTLDTIRYLVIENKQDQVYEMLETLGNFYRRFLSKGSNDIPLSEEIEIVKCYLKLQKTRYADVFDDEYEIEPGLEQVRVPRLILQPLVENSIYHGVRLKGEPGIIRVSVNREADDLVIKVYDTGIGMSDEKIEELVNQTDSRSFGIKGTISRIQYYYKKDDVFAIHSREGEYCEIELRLPVYQQMVSRNGGKDV